ncbi:alpha/beta hydrolase [Streptomyces sp. NPDC006235]|uniref:alpha/beta fold hydrolase n=1 Tax=Streptomyces sp. NPDC006235 TaxID=3156736 RepID=UPI0033BDFA34
MNASTGTHTTIDSEEPRSPGFDTATKDDAEFNKDFRHCFTTIEDVQMHYVIGGDGPQVMVLLHGWPHSWYVYRDIMAKLLPGRTVIAIDLPGMGDSTGTPPSMARKVLATYVHRLLDHLGYRENVQIVAHDFGAGVAYALAAQYRRQAAGLFLMDFPLVGKNLRFADFAPFSFHFSFNQQHPLAEELVTGRVETFLGHLFQPSESGVRPASDEELAEYVRVYSRPQVLHAGFELYRDWTQDEADNTVFQETPMTIPVRLLTTTGFAPITLPALHDAAPDAIGSTVPDAGHFLVHEAPDHVLTEINAFYPTA